MDPYRAPSGPRSVGTITAFSLHAAPVCLMMQAKAILDRQAEILRGFPSLALTVWGHADSEEVKNATGKALSFQRASTVRDYLVMRGIAPERISTDSRADRAMIPKDHSEGTLALMRFASTETEDNPRSPR